MIFEKIFRSSFLRSVTSYGIANIINSLIPFFLLPILTKHLSPIDYGLITIYTLVINFITPFIGLGAQSTIAKRYFERDEFKYEYYLSNIVVLVLINTTILFVLVYIFMDLLIAYTKISEKWLIYMILISMAMNINLILLVHFQVTKKVRKYVSMQLGQSVIIFFVSIVCIVTLKYKWEGRMLGQMIGVFSITIMSFYYFINEKIYINRIDISYLKKIIVIGSPVVVHSVISLGLTMSDRIILSTFVGEYETGIYSVGQQLGSSIYLVTSAFNNAFVPWLFKELKRDDMQTKSKIVKFTYLYFVAIALLAIIIYYIIDIAFPMVIGDKFNKSFQYVPFVLASYVFYGMYMMVTNYFFYTEKTYILSFITSISAIINISLCYYLTLIYGTIGAAYASVVSALLFFLLSWYFSNKVNPMPWMLTSQLKKAM